MTAWDYFHDSIGGTGQAIQNGTHAFGALASQVYGATLGPTGDAARQVPANFIGGAGQVVNDFAGGVKGFYGGAGQVAQRVGNAGANLVEQVPVVVRDITLPAGGAIANAGKGANDLLTGGGSALAGAGQGVGSGLKWAGIGIGALVVIGIIIVIVIAFKNPRTVGAVAAA